jgi:hypothetical protein
VPPKRVTFEEREAVPSASSLPLFVIEPPPVTVDPIRMETLLRVPRLESNLLKDRLEFQLVGLVVTARLCDMVAAWALAVLRERTPTERTAALKPVANTFFIVIIFTVGSGFCLG